MNLLSRSLAAATLLGAINPAVARTSEGTEAAVVTAAAAAKHERIATEVFARRDSLSDARISPDGEKVVFRTVIDGKTTVAITTLDGKSVLGRFSVPEGFQYEWIRWAGSDRLLLSVSKIVPYFDDEAKMTRLLAYDLPTRTLYPPRASKMGLEGDDLLWVADDGSSMLLSFQRTVYDWPSVYRFDLTDPKDNGKIVQKPIEGIWEWYADNEGVVRMGTGWRDNKMRVVYRDKEGERFSTIARIGEDEDDKLFDVQRIASGSNEAFVLDEDAQGRVALVRYNLLTREAIETVYRNDDWDIDSATLDRNGKPIAVDFVDDRDRRVWLDEDLAKLQANLEKALDFDEVWIASTSRDRGKMLVFAGGETDPGVIYTYDAAAKRLDLFAEMRPGLPIAQLARPKPVSYKARDGSQIRGYLTLPPGREASKLPLIILPHGGPYGVRDKLRYDDEVQLLANRGYAVLQPNYRGSGGYGSAFEKLGDGQIGRAMQDDLDDAMDWAVGEGIADASRICVVGASYGGYAAMWAVLRNPERYRCAASFAGVTDWNHILKYDAKFFSRKGARKWKQRVEGEDFDLDQVSPLKTISGLTRPLLVAHGEKDTNVPFSQFSKLRKAAEKSDKNIEYLVFEDEGHGFERPENEAKWFDALAGFLERHNPPH